MTTEELDKNNGVNKVFVYSLATQYENLGDNLINRQLIMWLKSRVTVVIEDKDVPHWFLESVAGGELLKAMDNPRKYSIKSQQFYQANFFTQMPIDGIVLSPGHYGDSKFKNTIKKITILLVVIFLKIKGVSTYRVGISFGELSLIDRLLESLNAIAFKGYAVRDKKSKYKLLPFGKKKCKVIPDLSFLGYELFNSSTSEKNGGKLLISLRGDRRYPNTIKQYDEMVFNIIPECLAKMFNDITCYSQVKFDKDEQYRLRNLIKSHGGQATIIEEYADLSNIPSSFSHVNIVVSNRLHVLLPAMMMGRLVLAVGNISLDSKIANIFEDMGLGDLFFDVIEQEESFSRYLTRILDKEELFILKIKVAVEEQSMKVNKKMKTLFAS